jgi:cytidylate kinase
MDASVDERVNRKWIFIKERGEDISKEKVKEDLMRRDDREMGRAIDPLRPAKDAWVFDTTGLTIEQVVGRIESEVNKRKLF